jgi:hypothetical protein
MKPPTYETRQVDAAEARVVRAGRARRDAAESYMRDALAMARADASRDDVYFESLGLVRLYARIAFRLAAVAWANGEPRLDSTGKPVGHCPVQP